MLIPVSFLGTAMMGDFWKSVWPLGVLVLVSLGGMNSYYLINRRLLALLEKEDWPALASLLEKKIYQEGRYTSRNIRLLAQAYLVRGKFNAVLELEAKTAAAKPARVAENALIFGAARLLAFANIAASAGAANGRGNAVSTAEFFQPFAEMKRLADGEWIRWYYGFALTLERSFEKAKAVFAELARGARDPLAAGLAAYFLCDVLGHNLPADNELFISAGKGKGRALKYFRTAARWGKKAGKMKNQIHGAIIRKYFDEAGAWIFEGEQK